MNAFGTSLRIPPVHIAGFDTLQSQRFTDLGLSQCVCRILATGARECRGLEWHVNLEETCALIFLSNG